MKRKLSYIFLATLFILFNLSASMAGTRFEGGGRCYEYDSNRAFIRFVPQSSCRLTDSDIAYGASLPDETPQKDKIQLMPNGTSIPGTNLKVGETVFVKAEESLGKVAGITKDGRIQVYILTLISESYTGESLFVSSKELGQSIKCEQKSHLCVHDNVEDNQGATSVIYQIFSNGFSVVAESVDMLGVRKTKELRAHSDY